MRLRNITGCREMIGESEFVVHEPETMKGKWREAFGNDHPVYVEIGMGKGRFLMDMARLYPEINFIGIEKYSSVLLRAVQKLEEEELPNVRLIRMDAEDLENVFAQGELDRIYLTLSVLPLAAQNEDDARQFQKLAQVFRYLSGLQRGENRHKEA